MTIPIIVEPSHTGFRATTGGPLDLSVEAASAAEALAALQVKIDSRFEHGAILVHHSVPAPPLPDWFRNPIPTRLNLAREVVK